MTLHDTDSTAYAAAQFDDNFPIGIERHYWFQARNRVLDRALRTAERHGLVPPNPMILEIGCGTGIVVGGLSARGHDIWGVELGLPPRMAVPDRMTTETRAQDLEPEFRAKVDAIMALDVIEHLPDDVSFLRETLHAFPRCRTIFVTVPARPELWSSHDRHYGHYRRYTRTTLRRTLASAGLELATARYVFRTLYVAAAVMTLAGRDRDPVLTAPASRMAHDALAAVLSAEDLALGSLPIPGLSLLAVATRPL